MPTLVGTTITVRDKVYKVSRERVVLNFTNLIDRKHELVLELTLQRDIEPGELSRG